MSHLPAGPIHHLRLAVTDVRRSAAFYTEILGCDLATGVRSPADEERVAPVEGDVILVHQGMFIGLGPVDAERASAGDRFDPFRVGLDHLSFSVPSRADLDAAIRLLDERGVEHGQIRDLVPVGLSILAFFDPDGIALELTAPMSDRD